MNIIIYEKNWQRAQGVRHHILQRSFIEEKDIYIYTQYRLQEFCSGIKLFLITIMEEKQLAFAEKVRAAERGSVIVLIGDYEGIYTDLLNYMIEPVGVLSYHHFTDEQLDKFAKIFSYTFELENITILGQNFNSSDILFFETADHGCRVVSIKSKKYLPITLRRLNNLPENFIRTSSSNIVNIDKVKDVDYKLGEIRFLNSSETAYVSRTFRKVLKIKIEIFK